MLVLRGVKPACPGNVAGPIGCQAILAAWLDQTEDIADEVFFEPPQGVNPECDQKHTKMSHSLVISKATSSFQWESIRTGLIPCFPLILFNQMMLPKPSFNRHC